MTNPVITSILCINRRSQEEQPQRDYGYYIKTTNDGFIEILMDSYRNCCENFGVYAMKNNKNVKKSLQDYIGKEIVNIKVSEKGKTEDDEGDYNYEETRWIELFFKNDKEPLMLYLYNYHNGYYQHGCSIEWKNQIIPNKRETFTI